MKIVKEKFVVFIHIAKLETNDECQQSSPLIFGLGVRMDKSITILYIYMCVCVCVYARAVVVAQSQKKTFVCACWI